MYEYQDKCVALRCIHNLLPESPVEAVAVEWSTDYALLGEGEPELVSVKHRGPGQGDWTFGKLKDENVFRDLHAVWKAMGEAGDFVFESNAGYARDLACFRRHPRDRNERDTAVLRKLSGLLQANGEETERFVQHFWLREPPLPSSDYMDAVAERDLATVMERLGLDPATARQCFAALASRVAAASTERPPEPALRVTRLTGFMRDITGHADRDGASRVLEMAELRDVVAEESARVSASRGPASPAGSAPGYGRPGSVVEALPLAAAALDYAPLLARIGLDQFAGREWLITAIEGAVTAEALPGMPRVGRYVLVRAAAGLGKTTLAGRLACDWDCARHFTGAPGGRNPGIALQSLAAQLIIRYGLEGQFAVGGILAAWAADPARFPQILAAAAQRARDQGEEVRIVVDGLDEAEGDALALGLPAVPPDGVCILATYRDGITPHRLPSGEHVSTFTITAPDPANCKDVKEFLSSQARAPLISGRLADAGVTEGQFVASLARQCGGVWVYLRYVLSQVRLGTWNPADSSTLPAGLTAYYRQQVTGRRAEAGFHAQDLVFLATLAAVQQPVTLDQLCRITSLDSNLVRLLANYRYRPFLAADVGRAAARYSLYHASLREFLHGNLADGGDPVSMSELRQAAQDAHSRIADYYLNAFGELATSLEALQATPNLADQDDGYALRHLPAHLHYAGRLEDLRAVVTCHGLGSPLGSTWADAHDRAGTLGAYLATITMVSNASETKTDALIAAGRDAPSLAEELQYALIAASLVSRSTAVPTTLLAALARSGIWDSTRALAHAMRHHEPALRASALLALLPGLDDAEQAARASEDALLALAAVADEQTRTGLLEKLLPYLDREQTERAWVLADHMRTDLFRAQAITFLVPRLEGEALARALRSRQRAAHNVFLISAAASDPKERAGFLAGAAHLMEDPGRARALDAAVEAAAAIGEWSARGRELGMLADKLDHAQLSRALDAATIPVPCSEALIKLAPFLSEDQLDGALSAATRIGGQWERGRALAGLARYLSQKQIERALDAVAGIENQGIRATAQLRICRHAGLDVPEAVIESALAAARQTEGASSRCAELRSLAVLLEGPDRARALDWALEAATAVTNHDIRGRDLANLVPRLLPSQFEQALNAAAAITHPAGRALALTAVARRLTGPSRTDAIMRALDGPWLGGEVGVALVELASEAGEPLRHVVMQSLLDAAAAMENDIHAMVEIQEFARHLDHDQLTSAIGIAAALRDDYARAGALAGLAPYLDRPQLRQALQALTAPGFADFQGRAQAVANLAPHLQGQSRAAAVKEVLEAAGTPCDPNAQWPFTHDDESIRADLIFMVAPYLDPGQLAWAQQAANSFTDGACRVYALTTLAAYLQGPERKRAVGSALLTASQIEDAQRWGRALARVAPYLDEGDRGRVLARALEGALGVPGETARAELLISIAPHLNGTHQPRALQAADSFTDSGCKAAVLASLAASMEEPGRSRAIEDASKALESISDPVFYVWASAHIIPHLKGEIRSRAVRKALHATEKITHRESRIRALVSLSPYTEGLARISCLETALSIAEAMAGEWRQDRALAVLAADLDVTQLGRALTAAAHLPYLGDHRPHEQLFWRLSDSASDATCSVVVSLLRSFCRAWPPREALLAVIGAAAQAIVRVGGSEAAESLFDAVRQDDQSLVWRLERS